MDKEAGRVPPGWLVHGDCPRLDEPRRCKIDDPRSPLVVAELTIPADAPVAPLSHVRLRGSADVWAVLGVHEHTIDAIRDVREKPTRINVPKEDVVEHLPNVLPVHSADSTLVSPRTFS